MVLSGWFCATNAVLAFTWAFSGGRSVEKWSSTINAYLANNLLSINQSCYDVFMNGGFEGEQTYVNSPEEGRFQRDVERVYEIVLPTEGTRLHKVVRTDLFRGAVTEAEKAKAAAENGYDLRYLKSVGEEVFNKMKEIGMDAQATYADKVKLARFNTLVYGKPNPSSDEVLFGLSRGGGGGGGDDQPPGEKGGSGFYLRGSGS